MQDPPAGQWFAEQARELIEFASPELKPQECHVAWDAKGKGKAFFRDRHRDLAHPGVDPGVRVAR